MKNIKQINGVPCVLGKVHMLSTENLGVIMSDVGPYDTDMVLISELPEKLRGHERPHNHLYITDDSEINESDWCYNLLEKFIFQAKSKNVHHTNRKIISSTDPKLTDLIIQGESDYFNGDDGKKLNTNKLVSKIPQQLIQDYCNKPVDEVWIPFRWGNPEGTIKHYTLNSINEAIIHPIEEKTYTREDMIAFGKECAEYGYENELDNEGQLTDEFIERNL